jgi:hypothetical protein
MVNCQTPAIGAWISIKGMEELTMVLFFRKLFNQRQTNSEAAPCNGIAIIHLSFCDILIIANVHSSLIDKHLVSAISTIYFSSRTNNYPYNVSCLLIDC